MTELTHIQNQQPIFISNEELKGKNVSSNNGRWIKMSEETLKKNQNNSKYCVTKLAVASIAFRTLFGACLGLSYFFYTKDSFNLSLISFGASLASCVFPSIPVVNKIIDYHREKNTRLDPSQIDKVNDILNDILNGNIREDCRIREFGILSEKVYSKFQNLVNEKKSIEDTFLIAANKKPLSIDRIKEILSTYDNAMNAWEVKWEKFIPELKGDFPDPNLISESQFPSPINQINQIFDV